MGSMEWRIYNPSGTRRVIVTKALPGERWLNILIRADCSIEICQSTNVLTAQEIIRTIGTRCHGAIGQLTETWGETLFATLKAAGGRVYSNYAVGFNNIDLPAATRHLIPVGNTPGVLTETTAEMAVALTFAAARRIPESERFLRAGRYQGWLPTLFMGELLWQKTLGIVGVGRIGSAYARMMVEGHKMNLVYCDLQTNRKLEEQIAGYSDFLVKSNRPGVTCNRAETLEGLLQVADVVSLHTSLDPSTRHLIDAERLGLMKENAILINTSRGPVIDEAALVAHCREHPDFKAGLDVFEDEPAMKPGLAELENVVIVPHIASATSWTRQGMATLAAGNVAAILSGFPVWPEGDIGAFLTDNPPDAAPSIINADDLGLPRYRGSLT